MSLSCGFAQPETRVRKRGVSLANSGAMQFVACVCGARGAENHACAFA